MFLKINAFEHKTEKWHESRLLCLKAISVSVSTASSDKTTVELVFLFNRFWIVTPHLRLLTFETLLTEKILLKHTSLVFLDKKKGQ